MNQHGYAVAIVGASGEVGRSMIETLERYPIPVSSLRLLASKRSAAVLLQTSVTLLKTYLTTQVIC